MNHFAKAPISALFAKVGAYVVDPIRRDHPRPERERHMCGGERGPSDLSLKN
jgi:hypothetical protein